MKKHNLLKVVLISIAVACLLTWIFTTTQVQYGEVIEGAREQVGLLSLFTYPSLAIYYLATWFAFVLGIGAFYGVLSKTGAYRTLLDKIVNGFKGREWFFLTLTMILIAAITSFSGLNYAVMFLFPIIISIILLMGYNKLVAATTTVGALLIGIMGTTFGTGNIPYMSDILGTTASSEIITKVIILVIGLILLVFNVLNYAKKTRNTTDLVDDGYVPAVEKTKKHIWPMVVLFDLTLLVMIISFIPWESAFNITLFSDISTWVQNFELFGFPIFAKLLGNITPFGNWSLQLLPMLLLLVAVVVGLAYRVKFNDFLKGILDGMKKAVAPAGLMIFIYTILIIMTYHPVQLTIAKWIMGLSQGFNIVTVGIVAMLSSLFNVDMMYVTQSTLPYITTVITDSAFYPLISVMFQSLYGLVMLIAPTSIVLMGTLAYLKIPYGQWVKHIWKLLLELFVVLFIIFTIVLLV